MFPPSILLCTYNNLAVSPRRVKEKKPFSSGPTNLAPQYVTTNCKHHTYVRSSKLLPSPGMTSCPSAHSHQVLCAHRQSLPSRCWAHHHLHPHRAVLTSPRPRNHACPTFFFIAYCTTCVKFNLVLSSRPMSCLERSACLSRTPAGVVACHWRECRYCEDFCYK